MAYGDPDNDSQGPAIGNQLKPRDSILDYLKQIIALLSGGFLQGNNESKAVDDTAGGASRQPTSAQPQTSEQAFQRIANMFGMGNGLIAMRSGASNSQETSFSVDANGVPTEGRSYFTSNGVPSGSYSKDGRDVGYYGGISVSSASSGGNFPNNGVNYSNAWQNSVFAEVLAHGGPEDPSKMVYDANGSVGDRYESRFENGKKGLRDVIANQWYRIPGHNEINPDYDPQHPNVPEHPIAEKHHAALAQAVATLQGAGVGGAVEHKVHVQPHHGVQQGVVALNNSGQGLGDS